MPLPTANGYFLEQRDRAIVLDLLAEQHRLGRLDRSDDHPALDLDIDAFTAAIIGLAEDGLASPHRFGTPHVLTAAGLAAHFEARQALDDLGAAIGSMPLPPLTLALPRRAAVFGAMV